MSATQKEKNDTLNHVERGNEYISERTEQLAKLPTFDDKKYSELLTLYKTADEKIKSLPLINTRISQLEKDLSEFSAHKKNAETSLSLASTQLHEFSARLKVIEEHIDKSVPDLKALLQEISALKNEISEFERNVDNLKKEISQYRITSYNVCYTKLLRPNHPVQRQQHPLTFLFRL